MNKGKKENRILPFITTLLLLVVLVHPVFHEFQDPMHIDFLSPVQAFENFHPEDIVANRDGFFREFDPAISLFSVLINLGTSDFFSTAVSLPFPSLSLDQQALILRC